MVMLPALHSPINSRGVRFNVAAPDGAGDAIRLSTVRRDY